MFTCIWSKEYVFNNRQMQCSQSWLMYLLGRISFAVRRITMIRCQIIFSSVNFILPWGNVSVVRTSLGTGFSRRAAMSSSIFKRRNCVFQTGWSSPSMCVSTASFNRFIVGSSIGFAFAIYFHLLIHVQYLHIHSEKWHLLTIFSFCPGFVPFAISQVEITGSLLSWTSRNVQSTFMIQCANLSFSQKKTKVRPRYKLLLWENSVINFFLLKVILTICAQVHIILRAWLTGVYKLHGKGGLPRAWDAEVSTSTTAISVPQQKNCYDCGIFMLLCASWLVYFRNFECLGLIYVITR